MVGQMPSHFRFRFECIAGIVKNGVIAKLSNRLCFVAKDMAKSMCVLFNLQ